MLRLLSIAMPTCLLGCCTRRDAVCFAPPSLIQRQSSWGRVETVQPEPWQDTLPGDDLSAIDEHGPVSLAATSASSASNQSSLGSDDGTKVNSVCVDYTARGYYSSIGSFQQRVPPTFVGRPDTLSQCELEQLHKDCVARINMYRSGELKFKDNTSDSNVAAGLTRPLWELTGNNRCSTHQALGDLVYSKPRGLKIVGAHHTFPSCGNGAQNSCGVYHKDATYSGVKDKMFRCLQTMWNEGITGIADGGHWKTMRNPSYRYVSCGFAWDDEGNLNMNQDFYAGNENKPPCSCAGKRAGQSDGCGGYCAACSEPAWSACKDADKPNCRTAANAKNPAFYCEKYDFIRRDCKATCNLCPVIEPTCPTGPTSPSPTAPNPTPTPSGTTAVGCQDDPSYEDQWGTCEDWAGWVANQGFKCEKYKKLPDLVPSCPRACKRCDCQDDSTYVDQYGTCSKWAGWVENLSYKCEDYEASLPDLLTRCRRACKNC